MDEDPVESEAGFAGLMLRPELLRALTSLGYEEPPPIQREAIPPLLEGRDLVGQAATGTGKTAAFALPLLQRLAGGAAGHAPPAGPRPAVGPDPRPHPRTRRAGGRGRAPVRTPPRRRRPAGLRRAGVRAAAPG